MIAVDAVAPVASLVPGEKETLDVVPFSPDTKLLLDITFQSSIGSLSLLVMLCIQLTGQGGQEERVLHL